MYKAIHYDGKTPLVDIPQYLRRHDIVCRRPALKPYDGLPVGTGCMGGLLFHTESAMSIQINHTDALDFAGDGMMKAWAWEAEEKSTAPVSLGTITIESDLPCFDWIYLEEYEERLNMADGCITGHAKTPFSELNWTVYGEAESGLLVFEVEAVTQEETAFRIRAQRWPSPVFFHHYEQIVPDYSKNLECVSAHTNQDKLVLEQHLGRCHAALAVHIEGAAVQPQLIHSRGGEFCLEKKKVHKFTVIAGAAVSEEQAEVKPECIRRIVQNIKQDLRQQNQNAWHTFWKKSFVHLGEADYIENLYYVYLYQLNSCGRGKYPITFAGLWSWFKDTRNWGHFYHWNHQQTYWPVLSAGHHELYKNYLDYRWKMLPQAREDAKRLFGANGAFYSDVSNLNGYNAIEPDTIRNCSVGAQIAMDFYRYYISAGDQEFLRDRALPMLTASADFYESMLTEKDGVLVIRDGAAAYESYWNLKETLTDYASLQGVLKALADIGEAAGLSEEKRDSYRKLAAQMYAPMTEQVTHDGKELEIYAAGVKWDNEPVGYGEGEYPYSPFPAALMSMVYPSGWIDLNDQGTEKFAIMKNTARVLLDKEIYQLGKLGCSGHAPAPQMAARLGMKEDMMRILEKYANSYQIFPNGLMHFADISQNQQWSAVDRPRIIEKTAKSTQWEEVHEKDKGIRTSIPSEWFLHCYFEAAANLTAGIQEMLLQSTGGIIRIFPAFPDEGSGMFTLWTEGGFCVTAEMCAGEIRYAAVTCCFDQICRLQMPWPNAEAVTIRCDGRDNTAFTIDKDILVFPVEKDKTYNIFRSQYPLECYYQNPFENQINGGKKQLKDVSLGTDKYY